MEPFTCNFLKLFLRQVVSPIVAPCGPGAARSAEAGPGPWGVGSHARGMPPQPLGGSNSQPRILTWTGPSQSGGYKKENLM